MRDGSARRRQALSRQGRYQQVRDNLRVKEVRIDSTPASGGSSATTPTKPNATRPNATPPPDHPELDRIAAARTRSESRPAPAAPPRPRARTARRKGRTAGRRRNRARQGRVRATRAPRPGRWLRQTPSGRLQLDRAKIAAEEAGREVPAVDLGSGPIGRGRRAGLQEPARGRTRVPRPEVHHRAAPGVPPARTPHPRPRAAVLAGPAAHPGRRTPHRADLAAINTELWRLHAITLRDPPAPSCRPPPHRRPVQHSSGLRRAPPAPGHPPRPRLSWANTPHARLSARGHTRSSTDPARSRRSHPRFEPSVCPRTAEPRLSIRRRSPAANVDGDRSPAGLLVPSQSYSDDKESNSYQLSRTYSGARGGSRTHTSLRTAEFESVSERLPLCRLCHLAGTLSDACPSCAVLWRPVSPRILDEILDGGLSDRAVSGPWAPRWSS